MTDLSVRPTSEAPPTKTYNIRGIPVDLLSRYWPFAAPYIKRALDRGTGVLDIEDFYRFAKAAQIQLWLVHDGTRICGAVTTEIVHFPALDRLRVITLGGPGVDLWAGELDRVLCEWARIHKCDGIEAYVRKGGVAKMREHGYKHLSSMVFKPLPSTEETV